MSKRLQANMQCSRGPRSERRRLPRWQGTGWRRSYGCCMGAIGPPCHVFPRRTGPRRRRQEEAAWPGCSTCHVALPISRCQSIGASGPARGTHPGRTPRSRTFDMLWGQLRVRASAAHSGHTIRQSRYAGVHTSGSHSQHALVAHMLGA